MADVCVFVYAMYWDPKHEFQLQSEDILFGFLTTWKAFWGFGQGLKVKVRVRVDSGLMLGQKIQ